MEFRYVGHDSRHYSDGIGDVVPGVVYTLDSAPDDGRWEPATKPKSAATPADSQETK